MLCTTVAIQEWADAAHAAGSIEYDAIVGALNETAFQTVIEVLKLDEKGDVTLPGYVMYEWRNGDCD